MTDLDALLKAILANPAEDTPRLMYADALEERGRSGDAERAEFIRVQCEIVTLTKGKRPVKPAKPSGNSWNAFQKWKEYKRKSKEYRKAVEREAELRLKQRRLWDANAADWIPHMKGAEQFAIHASSEFIGRGPYAVVFGAVGQHHGAGRIEILWHRGFASEVRCMAGDWLANVDCGFAQQPIEKVTLTTQIERRHFDTDVLHLEAGYTQYETRLPWRGSMLLRIEHLLGRAFPGIQFEVKRPGFAIPGPSAASQDVIDAATTAYDQLLASVGVI